MKVEEQGERTEVGLEPKGESRLANFDDFAKRFNAAICCFVRN